MCGADVDFQANNTQPRSFTCDMPLFSVVIPARNEEKFLERCLRSIADAARSFRGRIEVIVVLNRCSDRTEEIARAWDCSIAEEPAKNLARIRNAGAARARGDILVTIDADSAMSSNMLEEISEALAEESTIGGGVAMYPERWSVGILLTALCLLPIAVWHGISGGLFFCRRKDFLAIGGFNEELVSVEDIDFAKRLRRYGKMQGKRFRTLFRAHIVTSCRKFDRLGDWHFVLRPWLLLTLLGGRNQEAADKVWYDFER